MANWKPKTEELIQRVTIRERVKRKNERGIVETEVIDRVTAYAAVDNYRDSSVVMDSALQGRAYARIRLRDRAWIMPGMLVFHDGIVYEIRSVDRYDHRRDFCCLECWGVTG